MNIDDIAVEAFKGRLIKLENGLFIITNEKTREGIFVTGWIRNMEKGLTNKLK